jgi:hypothetical protein
MTGRLGPTLLLLLLVLAVLMPQNPAYQPLPGRDSGVYLYTATQILEGRVPYRDVWDHKGPLIYYIDALGLWAGQGSLWGVWLLEALLLWCAALLGYAVMRQAFGNIGAAFGSLLWLAALPFLSGRGNHTEEYAIPLQFAAIYLFWRSEEGRLFLYLFLTGIAFALSFLLRPNNVGVPLSIAILVALRACRNSGVGRSVAARLKRPTLDSLPASLFTAYAALILGAAVIGLVTVIYFAASGALRDLADAAFRYNLIYSSAQSFHERLDAAFSGLALLSRGWGLATVALTAWAVAWFYAWSRPRACGRCLSLLHLALIGLPVELLLSSVSGFTYPHYYMTWLPICAMLAGFFAHVVLTEFSAPLKYVWLAGVIFAVGLVPFRDAVSLDLRSFRAVIDSHFAVRNSPEIERLRELADRYLIVWGAEAELNFVTNRASPSRYVYQYPFFSSRYVTPAMIRAFRQDIADKKPLIVDASSSSLSPRMPPIRSSDKKDDPAISAELSSVFEFVESNYAQITVIQPQGWPVYRYVGTEFEQSNVRH